MSEWLALGSVAVALYILECLAWIDAAAVTCVKVPLRTGWKCAQGATLPGNDRGGVVLADPATLRGSLVVCHVWPFALSPEGVATVDVTGMAPANEPDYIPFDKLETVRAEFGEIYMNGKRIARVASSVLASHLVQLIQHIGRCPVEERAPHIKAAIEQTLDEKAATVAWTTFQRSIRPLGTCCVSLFLFAFVVSPLTLLLIGPYPTWKYLLAGLFVFTLATAVTYFHVHAALYPAGAYDRWVDAASMLLLPVAAIRCVDKVSRDALCLYSCAVVSPMLCHRDDATPVLRQQFVDMNDREDYLARADTPAVTCARWFHSLLITETKTALDGLNLAIQAPPVPEDEMMILYCPRCHAQFGRGGGLSCPACSGIRLVAFSSQDHTGTGV